MNVFMTDSRATFLGQITNDPCLAKSYNNPPPGVTKSLLKLVTVLVFFGLLLSFTIFYLIGQLASYI